MSMFKVGDKVIRKPRIDNRIFERHQGVLITIQSRVQVQAGTGCS
jgi:hypothetical protein